MADQEVVGAVKAVALHPTDAAIVYVGTVNGGVWRTENARDQKPAWEQLTDDQRSLSIGALALDPTDGTHRTLLAGTGRFSSLRRVGGALIGLLRTTDGGATWTTLDAGGQFRAFHLCDVAPRGQTIVVAGHNAGVFRTTDGGGSWTRVSGGAGTGLPAGNCFALADDPTRPARLFAHVGAAGIFETTDTGGTWRKVSTAAMEALLPAAVNVKISVGVDDNVYVAIAGSAGLSGLFRSGDGGGSWAELDLPATVEAGGVSFGLHPGRQAGIHLSLAADRVNHQVVYIGGDRQPRSSEGLPPPGEGQPPPPPWPNSIGARDFSGRIFRVDASRPRGGQVAHLTHSNTASNSAPHADSRCMAIDARGDLIEGDDGGVYRRTRPLTNTGDWASINGDLQNTELHSAAWDAQTGIVIGGAQDTGTPQQRSPAGRRWPSVSTGDGAVTAVDDAGANGFSVRYSSSQRLGGLRREVYDATGTLQSRTRVPLQVRGGAARVVPQFYTPLELNRVQPTRLIIGADNGVYESDDQGDTLTAIAPGIPVNSAVQTGCAAPIAYGARGNPDVLYIGSLGNVLVRTAAHPAPLTVAAAYPGTRPVTGIAVPPDEPQTAFVIDSGQVFRTTDAGVTWSDITGNLLSLGGVVLDSVTFCEDLDGGSVIVGTHAGVFAASGPGFAWSGLGSGLPAAPVMRLRYSPASGVLLAATLGRGAWTLEIP
jgi:photosystem II stability/assembly factor-like uncharacterized protein